MPAKKKGKAKVTEDDGEGVSLDDAFADDDDVEYAKAKPNKKLLEKSKEREITDNEEFTLSIKASKPISKIAKGDKIKVDSLNLEVDSHLVLIDHGTTQEMAIECFDPKTDKDYQIRYFIDQVETSLEVYSLEEIVYSKMRVKKVEW